MLLETNLKFGVWNLPILLRSVSLQ